MTFPNLKARYRRINPKAKVDSIVELVQQGKEFLFVIRYFKSIDKYYLARTRWKKESKCFVVDLTKGDFEVFSKRLKYLKSLIPVEGTF